MAGGKEKRKKRYSRNEGILSTESNPQREEIEHEGKRLR